jgi:hypothetical protein
MTQIEIAACVADNIKDYYLDQAMDATDPALVERFVAFANVARTIAERIRDHETAVAA